jgi:hypothetical protein
MSILCAFSGHEAGRAETYNSGYWFSRCRRCGCDMIRSGAEWSTVPPGHRVVWKEGRHSHSLEPDYTPVLPTLHREANLPATRPPFTSWSRQMARLAGRKEPAPEAAAEAAAENERQEESYPGLLVLAALVGAGLQLLFGYGLRRREC